MIVQKGGADVLNAATYPLISQAVTVYAVYGSAIFVL